jgi:hypothetical protein
MGARMINFRADLESGPNKRVIRASPIDQSLKSFELPCFWIGEHLCVPCQRAHLRPLLPYLREHLPEVCDGMH